jgi:hypothetical protein
MKLVIAILSLVLAASVCLAAKAWTKPDLLDYFVEEAREESYGGPIAGFVFVFGEDSSAAGLLHHDGPFISIDACRLIERCRAETQSLCGDAVEWGKRLRNPKFAPKVSSGPVRNTKIENLADGTKICSSDCGDSSTLAVIVFKPPLCVLP